MLGFLVSVAAEIIAPLSLAAGILIGYLFHKEWKQLAWSLLLFVAPGLGEFESPLPAHGAMYQSAAVFIAVCLLTGVSFWAFEHFATRRQTAKPR